MSYGEATRRVASRFLVVETSVAYGRSIGRAKEASEALEGSLTANFGGLKEC